MRKVRKAIIPAAGLGTRFLPATKAMPKEMLPIVDKPAIQFIIEEAIRSGIEDIIIVTGRNKKSIEDHFDRNYELEMNLEQKKKNELLGIVHQLTNMVDIHYVRQKEALGLGHAIWCARKFIGEEPFAVLLGDMIIDSEVPCLKQILDIHEEYQGSVVAVDHVDWSEVHKYGVVGGIKLSDKVSLIQSLVEKPKENPPSNSAIVGRYIFEPDIFSFIEKVNVGTGNEIQLTDAMQLLAENGNMYSYQIDGKLFDVGNKLGYLIATVEFALKNQEVAESFNEYISNRVQLKNSASPFSKVV